MSDNDKENSKPEVVPFFARYLEGQMDYMEDASESEMQALAGGSRAITRKYPSDSEDSSHSGNVTTLKYPSDNEEYFSGGIVTQKYPSDNDEGIDK